MVAFLRMKSGTNGHATFVLLCGKRLGKCMLTRSLDFKILEQSDGEASFGAAVAYVVS